MKSKQMAEKERERFYELEDKAKEKFLEYSDFYAGDWLEDDEAGEYAILYEKFLADELA